MEKKKNVSVNLRRAAYAALFAAIISVCAQITVPGTIPFTMQTFAVFAAMLLLDAGTSIISVALYLAIGAVGVPVFAGLRGGIGVLLGPTGGYIWGFIIAVALYALVRKLIPSENFFASIPALLISLAALYLCGTLWFCFAAKTTFTAALSACVVPFIPFDLLKMGLALIISWRVAPLLKKV